MYRILIIEDSPSMRKLLTKSLSCEGFECQSAATAEAGFQACLQDKPDLVLLDVNLPDGNGIDLCRRLKAEAPVGHIPVLIITGEFSSVDSRVSGFDAGAEDYILKPFQMKELVARMRGILKITAGPAGL